MAGLLILAPIWMIPAVASTILHPNLAAEFPNLNNPHEASYVAMAKSLLPPGLLGLLVSAILAASVSSMTNQSNIDTGISERASTVFNRSLCSRLGLTGRLCYRYESYPQAGLSLGF